MTCSRTVPDRLVGSIGCMGGVGEWLMGSDAGERAAGRAAAAGLRALQVAQRLARLRAGSVPDAGSVRRSQQAAQQSLTRTAEAYLSASEAHRAGCRDAPESRCVSEATGRW